MGRKDASGSDASCFVEWFFRQTVSIFGLSMTTHAACGAGGMALSEEVTGKLKVSLSVVSGKPRRALQTASQGVHVEVPTTPGLLGGVAAFSSSLSLWLILLCHGHGLPVWSCLQLTVYLKTHEVDERTVSSQIREPAPKLGLTRLKLVRHVEALVRLLPSPRPQTSIGDAVLRCAWSGG